MSRIVLRGRDAELATVLRSTFSKLDIRSRVQLANLLRDLPAGHAGT